MTARSARPRSGRLTIIEKGRTGAYDRLSQDYPLRPAHCGRGIRTDSVNAEEFINILTGALAASIIPSASRCRRFTPRRFPAPSPRCNRLRPRWRTSICCKQGKGEIAFTLGDSLADAWNGNAEVGFKTKLDKLRTSRRFIRTTSRSPHSRMPASRRSPTEGQAAVGRRAEVGHRAQRARDSGGAGMSYKDLGQVQYLPFSKSVELMKNRQLDATLISAGSASRRSAICALRSIAPSSRFRSPWWRRWARPISRQLSPATPTKARPGVNTAIVPNYLVTRAGLPDQEVYEMTKTSSTICRAAGRACRRQGDEPRQGRQEPAGAAASRVQPNTTMKKASCNALLTLCYDRAGAHRAAPR